MRCVRLLWKRFMDLPITRKLLLGYVTIVLIPTLCLSFAVYSLNDKTLTQQRAANERYVVDKVRGNFGNRVTQIENLVDMLSSNSVVRQYLANYYPSRADAIYIQMSILKPLFKYATGALPAGSDIVVYSYHSEDIVPSAYVRQAPTDAAPAAEQNPFWRIEERDSGSFITCRQAVFNMDYSIELGYLCVTLRPERLFQDFADYADASVWTTDGRLLWSSREAGDGAPARTPSDDDPCFTSEALGIVCRFRSDDAESTWSRSAPLLVLLLFLCSLIFVLYYLLVRSSTHHLLKLKNHMAKADPDNLTCLAIDVYQDEAGQLITAFNHLTVRINKLLQDVYRTRMNKLEAEHYALQAQIEPHFLFNILENIRMEALSSNQPTTAEMIQRLGEYMHYNLKARNHPVPLLDELKHAKDYLYIHKLRKNSQIEYAISCHSEIDDFYCPCFTLQPLLENAIEHGMNGRENIAIHVDVYDGAAYDRPNDAAIVISDNGCGLTAERNKELQQLLNDQKYLVGSNHVGLVNVSYRLQDQWGADYRLRIAGKEGEGTTVTLFLRRDERKGDDHEDHHCG